MATNEIQQFRFQVTPGLEALDAYRLLMDHLPLLLDGNSEHPEVKQSIIAFTPRLEVRINGDAVKVRHDNGCVDERRQPPLESLRKLTEDWQFTTPHQGFTGGFVGIIGYGFTRAIEPTLPAPVDDAGVPDVCLRLCRDALVINSATGEATLWTTDLPGENIAEQRGLEILESLQKSLIPLASIPRQELTWGTSMEQATFEEAVRTMKEHIRTGDLFQANIATRFEAVLNIEPERLFFALRAHNPSPYLALMDWGDHCLVSGSPEQLFAVENGIIRARPIAGTRRRGEDRIHDELFEVELLTDRKEQAEHTMLVDLVRNDLAKVSVPGTVHVPERGSVERYRRVMHLVSRVEGTVRPGTGFTDWLAALFPGGTITGAPKHRACLRIHEAEPVARGHYTGSAGFLSWDHSSTHWNILIRSMVLRGGRVSVHAGSGIVNDSDPEREWHEAGSKAQALLEAATGQADSSEHGDEGSVKSVAAWTAPERPGTVSARVLLIDHYDSFVHNIANYCASLGASVDVVRCDGAVDAALERFKPTHMILGPGPGWPDDAGYSLRLCSDLHGRLPILGICLGHQALAQAAGAKVQVANRAVHGEIDDVFHDGTGILARLPSPFQATRYHSLMVEESTLPADWQVTARLADGTVMAMQHREHPSIGLQFHPESIGTDVGLEILFQFLNTA